MPTKSISLMLICDLILTQPDHFFPWVLVALVILEDFEEDQHIGYITRDLQRDRIQETICKKGAYLAKEKANIEQMPVLIGMEARRRLLKEEAKLKLLIAFQDDCIEMGKSVYKVEKYISEEQNDKFVYDLNVACL